MPAHGQKSHVVVPQAIAATWVTIKLKLQVETKQTNRFFFMSKHCFCKSEERKMLLIKGGKSS